MGGGAEWDDGRADSNLVAGIDGCFALQAWDLQSPVKTFLASRAALAAGTAVAATAVAVGLWQSVGL